MLRKLLIPAACLALPMAMLYPLWACPTSAGEDDVVWYWPVRKLTFDAIRAGRLPTWNPYEACGVPLLADPQTAVAFPPNWLFAGLPTNLAYSLCIFSAFACAGGGAWLYLRRLGLAAPAAAFGATAFTFCGFMVGHRVHLGMVQTAAFLPWGLWAIEGIRASGRRAFLWLGPIFALTLAAGHWPTAIQMSVVWAAYLLLRGRPLGRALLVVGGAAAVAALLMAPQIVATLNYVRGSVRADLPYAVAGENSFFPLCGVLAFFPFIMGCRTQNLFPHDWWGPWHLCEMLGYVGLVTLVLALGAVWCFYRRYKAAEAEPAAVGDEPARLRPVVRAWSWLLIGAGVWALGYYTPVYRLVYRVPVVGMVRCPARMLLAIDLGLATLAAAAVHALAAGATPRLRRALRWTATLVLPAAMLLSLGLLWLALLLEGRWWRMEPLLSGRGVFGLRAALTTPSATLYVPTGLLAATIAVLWWVSRRGGRRVWLLAALVLADLFFIARFVDVPGRPDPTNDPTVSPAAEWLRTNAPKDEPYRVWGLSWSYHDRPGELLLPMTCGVHGVESISYYGPLQPANHPLLLGFRPWGQNMQEGWLLHSNHLLSLFGVRYIALPADGWLDSLYAPILKDVRMLRVGPRQAPVDLLAHAWDLEHAERWRDRLRLKAPARHRKALAGCIVPLGSQIYCVSIEVRAPRGTGQPLYLSVGRATPSRWVIGGLKRPLPPLGLLRIDAEQINDEWREFRLYFPRWAGGEKRTKAEIRVDTASEGLIEVRNIRLSESDWPGPINFGHRLKADEAVYVDRTPGGLPPARAGDGRVHIYENRLCLPRRWPVRRDDVVILPTNHDVIEALRWKAREYDLSRQVLVAREDLPGGRLPEGPLEFVSERLHVRYPGRYVRANALGALGPAGGPRGPETTRLWPFLPTLAAVALWLAAAVFPRRRPNLRPEDAV